MSAGTQLATGWLELTVSTKGAQKSIVDEVGGAGSKASESLGSTILGGLKKFAVPIAAVVGAFSVGKLVKDSEKAFMDLTGSVNALQRIAGGTKEQVSGLRGALQLSGVDADKASGALTIFSKNLGNAAGDSAKTADLTAKLGTSFLDASGQVKPMADILPGLADKFKSMPDGAEKTALATQLFGRSGAQMLPFLNKGSEGIGQLTDKAKQMGLVVDDVSAKAFGAAKVSQREYQMSIQGLMVTLGGGLLPITTAVQNVYRNTMIPIIQAATGFLASHRDAFLSVAGVVQGFADRVQQAMTGVFSIFTKNQFDGNLTKALGLEEDSAIVGVLFTIRDAFAGAFGAIGSTVRDVFSAIGPAFAQLAPVFQQLVPPLTQAWQSLSPLSLIFQALMPVLPQIAGVLASLATTVGGALGAALQQIVPVLANVASLLVGALGQAIGAVVPVIGDLASTLGPVLGSVITALVPVISQLVGIIGPVLGQVITAIMPVITNLVSILGPVLTNIITALAPIVGVLANAIGMVLSAVAPLIEPLLSLVTPILSLIEPIATLVGTLLPPIIQLFVALLGPILSLIQPILGLLVPALSFIATVLGTVVGWISTAIDWFVKLVTGNQEAGAQFRAVWDNIMGFFGGIGRFFANVWQGLLDGIGQFGKNITSFFQSIPKMITDLFSGAGKWLFDVGRNIIQGLLDGAGSLLRNIGNFFLDVVPAFIREPFKAALGIHSPSRVFREYGQFTMQGFIDGVEQMGSNVAGTLSGAVSIPDASTVGPMGAGAAIYVQNPFTGDYMLAQMADTATQAAARVVSVAGAGRSR
jgi:phage-related protein